MDHLRPLPPELEIDAHLANLESAGFTIVRNAIPPPLLARLRACHAQAIKRVRECKPPADWSFESDNPGVVDYFRCYSLDPAYEELLTLPSIMPIVTRAITEGWGVRPHPGGPRLVHEMGQHLPGGTQCGQWWHRDGGKKHSGYSTLRCNFTLNDLAPNGGGTILLPGSHRAYLDDHGDGYGAFLNSQERHKYAAPREGRSCAPYDRSCNPPHQVPGAVTFSGPAGSCMLNWTMIWHTRPPNYSDQPRDIIWQIFKGGHYSGASRPSRGPTPTHDRREHHSTREWVDKVLRTGSEQMRALVDDTAAPAELKWDFEGLPAEARRRTQAAEPLWPRDPPAADRAPPPDCVPAEAAVPASRKHGALSLLGRASALSPPP